MGLKLNTRFRHTIVNVICWIYALLFTYASMSKLLDFQNFRIQLGQSPLISSFADWVSIVIPAIEFIIVILLLATRFRSIGLIATYTLMVMFTTYIYIILNYSTFVPCSCGGILEKMTWKQHLTFNIVFVILAGVSIVLIPRKHVLTTK